MGDGGSTTLKTAYTNDQKINIPSLGKKIGHWLATLHFTTQTPQLRAQFDNKVGKSVYKYSYNNLAVALEKHGYEKGLGESINAKFGALLESDDICVCHGDFWPGNILLSDHVDSLEKRVMVVDWEMVRNGNGATDVGQFAAEAWLLDRFRGGRGLLDSFLKGYLEERELEREDCVRVAVQFGTHLGFWTTRVEWAGEEETRVVVGIGSGILKAVEEENWEMLESCDIGVLFKTTTT